MFLLSLCIFSVKLIACRYSISTAMYCCNIYVHMDKGFVPLNIHRPILKPWLCHCKWCNVTCVFQMVMFSCVENSSVELKLVKPPQDRNCNCLEITNVYLLQNKTTCLSPSDIAICLNIQDDDDDDGRLLSSRNPRGELPVMEENWAMSSAAKAHKRSCVFKKISRLWLGAIGKRWISRSPELEIATFSTAAHSRG